MPLAPPVNAAPIFESMMETIDLSKVPTVLAEVERQAASKRDFIWPAEKLAVDDAGRLILGGQQIFDVGPESFPEWDLAEARANATGQKIVVHKDGGGIPLRGVARNQLAERLGIPGRYVDLLSANHSDLLSVNFTTLLERSKPGTKYLVRSLDGGIRAILSNSYRVMDNADVFFASFEAIKAAGATPWKARLWADGFELFAVSPRVVGVVERAESAPAGTDGHAWTQFKSEGPDWHFAGLRISNSETGFGGLNVRPCVLRSRCINTATIADGLKMIHAGRRQDEEGLIRHLGIERPDGGTLLSEGTRRKEADLVWSKVRDAIAGTFDESRFKAYLDRLSGATAEPIGEPEKAVDNVVKHYDLTEARKADIKRMLMEGRDYSRFGLTQAVTASAKLVEDADPSTASDLESYGGDLLQMPAADFRREIAAIAV